MDSSSPVPAGDSDASPRAPEGGNGGGGRWGSGGNGAGDVSRAAPVTLPPAERVDDGERRGPGTGREWRGVCPGERAACEVAAAKADVGVRPEGWGG